MRVTCYNGNEMKPSVKQHTASPLILKQAKLQTPIGIITITASETLIHAITLEPIDLLASFSGASTAAKDPSPEKSRHAGKVCTVIQTSRTPLLKEALEQLTDYFEGTRILFTLPLDFEQQQLPKEERPSPFRQKVWHALCSIPYGQTRSYAHIAKAIKSPSAVRAIGGANNANPFIIVVPCHRVINADGSLGGYACGAMAKKYLLQLEEEHSPALQINYTKPL